MTRVQKYLRDHAQDDLLPWRVQSDAAQQFSLSFSAIEELALSLSLLPARYQRNCKTISVLQQLTLFLSRVVVVGCGGLGGYVIEELARLGVGTLVVVDPDAFEEHNLNRQLLSSIEHLGAPKVEIAVQRVAEINPAVTVIPRKMAFTSENARELLHGADLVIDALDSIHDRLALADACATLQLPVVHGAIGGWYGQVATQFPGEMTIQNSYRQQRHGKGVEQQLGNPSFTPAVIASLQVAEACKVLLGEGARLCNRQLHINLHDMTFDEILFEPFQTTA